MVAYSFQPQFVPMILDGRKTSTIRPPRGGAGHAKVGQSVHCFTGMRGPECQRLLTAPCTLSRPIAITERGVIVDGRLVTVPEFYTTLAAREGFETFGNLQAWFDRRYGLPCRDLTQICWDHGQAVLHAGNPQEAAA